MKIRMSRRDFLKASAFAGAALSMGMSRSTPLILDSPIGKQTVNQSGSVVGVVRVEAAKSYSGMGGLLQEYLNNSSPGAWDKIRAKIDYTYENHRFRVGAFRRRRLDSGKEIQSRIEKGQKLFFKPIWLTPLHKPQTNGPDPGSTACTEWALMAALMRWFHDKLEISYHQMTFGEAATSYPLLPLPTPKQTQRER